MIIDEFDDIDSAFYTGNRGEAFVKALRSLSEMGLAFFLVGSERMKSIYARHSAELNKWIDLHLDRIESRADCRALVVQPVSDAIEYDDQAVEEIIDYCGSNPFYMQLLCTQLFQRCSQENRTYISEGELQDAKRSLLRTLGETSFAHLWGDNPVLEPKDQMRSTAENALVLSVLARVGGQCESADSLAQSQGQLDLAPAEILSGARFRDSVERLRQRGVLRSDPRTHLIAIDLPILQDWLADRAELAVLPT